MTNNQANIIKALASLRLDHRQGEVSKTQLVNECENITGYGETKDGTINFCCGYFDIVLKPNGEISVIDANFTYLQGNSNVLKD